MASNGALLLATGVGVRQAGAVVARTARPAAFFSMPCGRTLGR